MTTANMPLVKKIEDKIKTIYDPEFPMVDIFTLGLIYDIKIDKKNIAITMTFTTPFCPMASTLQEMIKQWVLEVAPTYEVEITVTFDPPRTIEKIKDSDLKNLFC